MIVFIKKECFVDYLIMFDDRPYQMLSRVKVDNNCEMESKEQEMETTTRMSDRHMVSYVIKPFSIPDSLSVTEEMGGLQVDVECVDSQNIGSGDKVLFLNEQKNRLRLYNVFLINEIQKSDSVYDINLEKKQKVNKTKESEIIQQFNEEE